MTTIGVYTAAGGPLLVYHAEATSEAVKAFFKGQGWTGKGKMLRKNLVEVVITETVADDLAVILRGAESVLKIKQR